MSKLIENDIRPIKYTERQRIFALVDLGRILSKRDDFVYVDCPACDSNNTNHKFEKNGISYVECKNCSTFYVNPRPPSKVLDWFYKGSPNYAYWNDVIFPASENARREKIFVPRVNHLLELCLKYKVNTSSLLEVGSGFGTFCSEVKKRNVFDRVVAVEPTPDLANTCRSKGLDVIELPIEKIEPNSLNMFDVVASFEVLEHLFSPKDFIRNMTRLLKPGGIVILACPNGQGFDIQTLGVLSSSVDHEHLNYFNPSSLGNLLVKNGLEVIETFTPGVLDAELVRNKILSNEFDVTNQPFLKKVLIDEWDSVGSAFQDFLIAQGMSSNMWLVARKPID
jgi:2-polyprenyl-3-methyl-5-hydroxy-6-metoxy-1,4-benzoquinol methylase